MLLIWVCLPVIVTVAGLKATWVFKSFLFPVKAEYFDGTRYVTALHDIFALYYFPSEY
jgi:hypothetical protein